jgi:hypothetical protein
MVMLVDQMVGVFSGQKAILYCTSTYSIVQYSILVLYDTYMPILHPVVLFSGQKGPTEVLYCIRIRLHARCSEVFLTAEIRISNN